VRQITQAAWCLVDMEALALVPVPQAARPPPPPAPPPQKQGESEAITGDESAAAVAQTEPPGRYFMRLVLQRLEELNRQAPFTPTQLTYVQQLVRDYRYKHELEFGLLPQPVKLFCRSLFEVPTTIAASLGRKRMHRHGDNRGPSRSLV